jgi:hypothetical protein
MLNKERNSVMLSPQWLNQIRRRWFGKNSTSLQTRLRYKGRATRTKLKVEQLETRVVPAYLFPNQVTKGYGIDQIKFGSAVGNGAGQTFAIIDANDEAGGGSGGWHCRGCPLFLSILYSDWR